MIKRFVDSKSRSSREARQALEDFVTLAQSNGIQLGMIPFPELTHISHENYPLEFPLDRVLKFFQEKEITCVDLQKVLSKADSNPVSWTIRLDAHPGPLANSLAAAVMIEKFRTLGCYR